MKSYKNVSTYLDQAPLEHQPSLRELRHLIQTIVPDAQESISYGMPAYTWQGKPLFYFAAMKGHLGLYPTSGPIQTLAAELTKFSTSKGCVRVPWNKRIPKILVTKLIKARIREIREMNR